MNDEIEPEGDALTPPPARRTKKKEPTTVQIRSGGPIPPGKIDSAPQRRSGPDPQALIIATIGLVILVALIAIVLSR